MAKWWVSPNSFTSFLGDRIGYKSGLALTRNQLLENLALLDPIAQVIKIDSDEPIRIKTDQVEDAFQSILFRIGVTNKPFVGHAPTLLSLEFQNSTINTALLNKTLKLLGEYHYCNGNNELGENFDFDDFYTKVKNELSIGSLQIAKRLIQMTIESEEASPWEWLKTRQYNWNKAIELKELFENESLESMYGTFLDQRYIDYLSMNIDSVSKMHWRKFEGLTAEFFIRKGYKVEIGPGRNDGGVDVRVWKAGNDNTSPPVILVQCKRQKAKIDKVIVKSLWADVINEKATSGMIVTSSYLSPGAREVCTARSYPISETNRDTLKLWLGELRSPGKGIFLGG